MKNARTLFVMLFSIIFIRLNAEIPAGYYHKTDNKKGYELLNILNEICSNGKYLKYGSGEGSTWEGFFYTDRNSDGSVIDMYSNNIRYQTTFAAVEGLHIEHSLPKSWWGGVMNYAYRDLHHLFPGDGITNITKSALPLGEVANATYDNEVSKIGSNSVEGVTGNCFEPSDEYKGDFARAYLYVSTIYNELSNQWQSPMMENNTYPVWKPWAIELLLKWHRDDPVSEKESARQEAIYGIQHNRNPYIDYPEMVEHIWGNKTTQNFELPEDNRPYLTSPNQWDVIESELAYVGTSVSRTITIQGGNLTAPLTISLQNNTQGINLSTTQVTPSSVEQGAKLTINFTSSNICTIEDTLILTSTGLTTQRIPLRAGFTNQLMITKFEIKNSTTAELRWTSQPNESLYKIEVYKGEQAECSNLMITDYIEGSSWNKAIALYNGTDHAIDLKYYSLGKQNNGTGRYNGEFQLRGIIAPHSSYVLVHGGASTQLKAKADSITTTEHEDLLSFNGNDALFLYHNGVIIDAIGVKNNSQNWGADVTMKRKNNISAGNTIYDKNEWDLYPIDDISKIGDHTISISPNSSLPTLYQSTTNSIIINNLAPNNIYTATVTTQPSNIKSVNRWQITMPALEAPEAYEATAIAKSQFKANWDIVPQADGYLINLFQITGSGTTDIYEGFDNITANGTPLPDRWSGNASGSYTTAASSGENAPSIGLKGDKEWIQTPLEITPLTQFSCMYRFASTATGSFIKIYAIDNNNIAREIDSIGYVNTKKSTIQYNSDMLSNAYAIKIEYTKVKGNLAIDDIRYSFGELTNTMIEEDIYTTNNYYTFYKLESSTTYYYNLRAVINYNTTDESTSALSNTIKVNTNELLSNNSNISDNNNYIQYYTYENSIYIENISGKNLHIYDTTGKLLIEIHNCQSQEKIDNLEKGIYIAIITDKNNIHTTHKISL